MTVRAIGIEHRPLDRARGGPPPLSLYRHAVRFKANPRDREFMLRLFAERYPGCPVVAAAAGWAERAREAETVVLLYPDATGLGFGPLERRARSLPGELRALTGRRRDLALTPATRRRLRVRRLLERTMLAELLALPVFVAATPVLAAIDLVRGRR